MYGNVIGLKSFSEEIRQNLNCYQEIMIMLYAVDTVLGSETEDNLPYQLYCFQMYCEKWKLQVNV